jgi:hypothetical protein
MLGAAEAMREEIQTPMPAPEQVPYEHLVGEISAQLGETLCSRVWNEGRSIGQEGLAVEYVLFES